MENFFNENEKLNNIEIKEKDFLNVNDFSRDSNITLGSLPQYEDLQKKQVHINLNETKEFAEVKDFKSFEDREFKKQEDKSLSLIKFRVKLFVTVYLLVTLLIGGFVIYNLVNTILLSNQISQNETKINDMTQTISRLNNSLANPASVYIELPTDLNI